MTIPPSSAVSPPPCRCGPSPAPRPLSLGPFAAGLPQPSNDLFSAPHATTGASPQPTLGATGIP
ncbi:hypothetical protein BVRB_017640 [Beta vulgaris subsp. vulgaris]|uniref:Uncharacterized protein n=1 Tax=Beta vulgaris subsp. vulgaris TaxID=3555 RepID=A0A0J7YM10_BETVV|nr:hypothetical protein BVRB_017640 [Beta vulgaris subsp. vulgaris]